MVINMADEKQALETSNVNKDDVVTQIDEVKGTAKKAAKKVTKKVSKKASSVKKKAKKVTKKAAKKVAKKSAVAKKTAKKVTKKSAKKVTKKATKSSKKKASKKKSTKVDARIAQIQAMLQENLSGLSGDKAEAMAKNIWLAGLGAYSKTYEELSERYEDVHEKYEEINSEGQKVFNALVDRGQLVQDQLETKVSKGKETLEDRVEEIKNRLGGGLSSFIDIPERLRDAAEKIEEFSHKLRKNK